MSFEQKLFNLTNSKNIIKHLFYGFLILLAIDILSTLYILTFLPATTEKNFIARLFISKFGIFWGLIISVPFEFVVLGITFIIFYIFLYLLTEPFKSRIQKWPDIYCISLIIVLFISILLHLNGILNNFSLLVSRMLGF